MPNEESDDARERWPIRPMVTYAIAYTRDGVRHFLTLGSIHHPTGDKNFMADRVIKYKTKDDAIQAYEEISNCSPTFAASGFEVVEVSCSVRPIRFL